MKKTEKIIGLPVIDLSTGNQVGKVWDIIINGEKGAADYLVIDDGLIILGAKVVAAKDVQGIGEYALTIKKRDVMREMAKVEPALELYRKNVRVKGTRVLTQKGRLVGGILDIYLNEDDCIIAALEFRPFNDTQKVKIIPHKEVITFGENLTVVVENLENILEDNFDGDEEVLNNKVESDTFKDEPKSEVQMSATEQRDLLYIDEDLKKSPADDLTAAPKKQDVKDGKKQNQEEMVVAEENTMEEELVIQENLAVEEDNQPVIVQEDEIGPTLIEQEIPDAIENGTILEQIEQEKAEINEEERVEDENFKEGISAANYSYKPNAEPQPKQDNKTKPVNKPNGAKSSNLFEQKQKEFLIGRKITKTIKDSKGNQILSEGEVITEEAVNIAKDAGKLIEIVMNNKP